MFGDRLRIVRKAKGFTLDSLAQAMKAKYPESGMNKGTLSKYENKQQEPMISTVKRLADLLGVSTDYLTGKSDNMNHVNNAHTDFNSMIDNMDDETFAKMLAAHAKPRQQLSTEFEDLDHFIMHIGYHIEKVNGSYNFSGQKGGYIVSENDLNLLLNQVKDFAGYFCTKLEKKLIEQDNDEHMHIEIPEPKKPNNL